MVAGRSGQPRTSPISAGEIFLVLGLLCLLGVVAAGDVVKTRFAGAGLDWPARGDIFPFDLNVKPLPVPADCRITIRNGRGDISVRSADDSQIHVDGKKNIKAWNETDAEHIASAISFEIAKNGDSYEVRPANSGSDSRARVDLDISVPKGAAVTIRNERGDVSVSDMSKPVIVNTTRGDVDIHSTEGDITIDTGKGDVKVSETNDNIDVRFSVPPKYDVEMTNSSSAITLSLPESSSFDIVADCHSCDIDSEFSSDSLKQTSSGGDSHLEGKYGKSRGPKITLTTSYGPISLRKTS